jgi:hypothetical protein
MSKGMQILALAASVIGAGVNLALAQTVKLESQNQVPGLSDQMSDKVAITNLGSIPIRIQYLKDNAWPTVEILPSATARLQSEVNGLKISFNDGAVVQNKLLDVGVRYAIQAKAGTAQWELVPYSQVGRGTSGLQSR